ncbi:MAG: glycosyltransferase family 4 protein [Chloroflexi bacterium]|nr:glycosyltransferase family 4 protein [Chloroflexota bacterium]
MKTIGIFHYKVGGTDGVSLEIDKWKRALEEMGHTVYLCGGDLGSVEGTLIEEMYHHRDDAKRLNDNMFTALRDYDAAGFTAEMAQLTDAIEEKIRVFVQERGIDFLIPQNVWSVAASPPVAEALVRVMRDLQLPALAHNHDFYWERMDGVALTCATAIEIADKYLPPRDLLARHVVINSLAQKELAARKGIEATVVPNVFDFEETTWQPDEYNQDFREQIGLREDDILVLQATRIVSRKGIELAIDFVQALGSAERRAYLREHGLYNGRTFSADSRIVLLLAGYTQDDARGLYLNQLKNKIAETGIDALFIEDRVAGRRELRDGHKIYSLWDTYVHADFVTYPSLWEGWGNQLLEAIVARLPFLLFEYPVYLADIKDKGLQAVSLGSDISGTDVNGLAQVPTKVLQTVADEAIVFLTNAQLRQEMVDHNFDMGRQNYSMAALRGYLAQLMADFPKN